jgi:hypothetical protein
LPACEIRVEAHVAQQRRNQVGPVAEQAANEGPIRVDHGAHRSVVVLLDRFARERIQDADQQEEDLVVRTRA